MNKTHLLATLLIIMFIAIVGCSNGESVSNNRYNSDGLEETIAIKTTRNTTSTTASLVATEAHIAEVTTIAEQTEEVTTTIAPIEITIAPTAGEVMQDGEHMTSIYPDGQDICTYPAGTIIVGRAVPERYVEVSLKGLIANGYEKDRVFYLDHINFANEESDYLFVRYSMFSTSTLSYDYRTVDVMANSDLDIDLTKYNIVYEEESNPLTYMISDNHKEYRDIWWVDRAR